MNVDKHIIKKIGLFAKAFNSNPDYNLTLFESFTVEEHVIFTIALSLLDKTARSSALYIKMPCVKRKSDEIIKLVHEHRRDVIKNLSNVLPNIYQSCYNCKYRKNCKKIEYVLNGGTGKSKFRCESYNSICHGCAYDRICGQTEEQQLKCLEGEKI